MYPSMFRVPAVLRRMPSAVPQMSSRTDERTYHVTCHSPTVCVQTSRRHSPHTTECRREVLLVEDDVDVFQLNIVAEMCKKCGYDV